jgi:hypothetical protein
VINNKNSGDCQEILWLALSLCIFLSSLDE